jgi:hypothetical protein
MQIAFANRSNLDIDHIVAIASEHMISHTNRRTLYVTAFGPEDEDEEVRHEDEQSLDLELESVPPTPFKPLPRAKPLPLIAVDSGVQELGTLAGGGLAIAVRAGALLECGDGRPLVLRYNTGGLVIDEGNRLPFFHAIGKRLGQPNLWVHVASDGTLHLADKTPLQPNEVKSAVRSFVERMVTEEAISVLASLGGGTLFIDGALPPSSYDLPNKYVVEMLSACAFAGVDVVALSKKTRYTVRGRPIGALFDDHPTFVGYTPIRKLVDSPRAQRGGEYRDVSAASEVYAARFAVGPTALTFRVDVHNSTYSMPTEVIERVYTDVHLYGGYPMPLIAAHQYSSFLGLDGPALAADLVARYDLRFEADRSMNVLFHPFNAFGK